MTRKLLLLSTLFYQFISFSQCPTSDIILNTQEDVDNFRINYPNCSNLQGSLTIEGDNITKLNELSVITKIAGNLIIQNTSNLFTLTGLTSIILIEGDVIINNNTNLLGIYGIKNVDAFQIKSLTISNNTRLSGCDAAIICNYISAYPNQALISGNAIDCSNESEIILTCSSLCPSGEIILTSQEDIDNFKINYPNCTVPNGIFIGGRNGSDITDLNGLNNIMASSKYFVIGNTNYGTNLVDFSGLESLRRVEQNFIITDNLKLRSLTGLENLEYVGEDLSIGRGILGDDGNPLLENLKGLKKLSSVGGTFRIIKANSITDLNGLESLTNIDGSIEICKTKNLSSLSGLDNIQNENINGDFIVSSNDGLVSLGDFSSLKSIKKRLEINSNINLESLSGLDNITSVYSSLLISGNNEIKDLIGLNSLITIGEGDTTYANGLNICCNTKLTTLEGLNNLKLILDGGLSIKSNDNLETVSVLTNLESIDGTIFIFDNDQLLDLNGMQNIELVNKQGIFIDNNDSLTSISGISNLDFDKISVLKIIRNPKLSICEEVNICNYLSNSENIYEIKENNIGCNNYEEVIQACVANLNTIKGVLKFDSDENGCSNLDYEISNTRVTTTDGVNNYSTFTNSSGEYNLFVNQGIYNTNVNFNSSYFINDPNYQESNFTTDGNIDIVDFCIKANQTINNVNITIIPLSEARPGFDVDYQIIYENIGTTVVNGAISFQFDEMFQSNVRTIPSADLISSNQLTFNFNELNPFEKRIINVTMNTFTPPTVNDGDLLILNANVTINEVDTFPDDNTFELKQTVVNSFDPNDKTVLQMTLDINNVDEYLNYVVRFQNTGSASAINVLIKDVLSDQLDWTTLEPVSASHEYTTFITNGNEIEFRFDNINLPSEQDNEEESNGFVSFKIKPKTGITVGDVITGEASIFFDFNAPIITNTVSTEITSILSTSEFEFSNIKVYPIPSKDKIYIKNINKYEISNIEFYNMNGRVVLPQIENESFNISDLSKGIYFIKIVTDQGEVVRKVVKD
ncbi:T9SS type A sorting domain-containing protein [Aquimarina sp. 433]